MGILKKALATAAVATALMVNAAAAENVKIAIVVKALGIGFFEAAAKGKPIHPGDGRLEEVEAVGHTAEPACWPGEVRALFLRQARHFRGVLQVVPGTEGPVAFASEHGNPGVVVVREFVPRLLQFAAGRRVQRVHRLRARNCNPGDMARLLVPAKLHGLLLGKVVGAC